MSDPMEAIRQSFFEECRELLEELEQGLLALQDGSADTETVGAVFRAVHSIKGGAGAFALDGLTRFAHDFETVLDLVRSDRLTVDDPLALTLLRAADMLADLAQEAAGGTAVEEAAETALRGELVAIAGDVPDGVDGEPALTFDPLAIEVSESAPSADFAPLALDLDDLPGGDGDDPESGEAVKDDSAIWKITFEPLPGLLASGNEPLFLFRALTVLGDIDVTCDATGLPDLQDVPCNELMIRWTIRLTPSASDLTRSEIENVFDFAEGLCHLEIERDFDQRVEVGRAHAAEETRPGIGPDRITAAPTVPVAPTTQRPASPTDPGRGSTPRNRGQSSSVRVDLERIDDLVNLVGEIVIAQAMLGQIASEPERRQELLASLDVLSQLTLEVQDSVMAIRALPVKPLFQRMSRIVREAAQMTGKDVRLVTEGEDTQIDKTVIELLADPLTHMVRNAVDHGLEDAATRSAAGKPEQGTVRLSAAQRSDRVLVEISDDGGGIDRERVLEKARSQGLVEPSARPEPEEIDRLLFLPGFSTSSTVSELSGRGVGMDVVNRAIQNLSGTISVQSSPGKGTTLTVSLPLTLAILDGMILVSGGDRYIMPLSAIIETMALEGADIQRVAGGGAVVRMHGRYIPLHDLAELLGRPASDPPGQDRTILQIDPGDGVPFALIVDDIEAQRQVVVKGLANTMERVPGISAATILGTGRVALILDSAGLQSLARHTVPDIPERLAS